MGNMVTLPTSDVSAYGIVPKDVLPPVSKPAQDITISPLKPPDNALPEIPSVEPAPMNTGISSVEVAEANVPAKSIEPIPLPSIAEMETALAKSGLLLPDLHVAGGEPIEPVEDTSPLANLQPGYKPPEQQF